MNAGRLRHRVTVQTPTRSANATGERTLTWSTVATVWAGVEPRRSVERDEASQQIAPTTYDIEMRYRSDITPACRLQWGGKVLNITSVINVGNRNREISVVAVEG